MLCWCWRLRSGAAEAMKQGLSFERGFLCPAGTEAIFYLLFGPPPAGARRGRLWGCAPFSAPLASPPKHPAGLVASPHSHGLAFKGLPYPSVPRGLRGFCSGSFLAALGDLPARRAMPACAFALNERTGDVWLAEDVPKDSGLDMIFLLL